MSTPSWRDLIANVDREFPPRHGQPATLSSQAVERLKTIDTATECLGLTLTAGLSAIGTMLAHTAQAGQLDDNTAIGLGWLIDSLATLAGCLADEQTAASYKLYTAQREVPQP